jgi:acyl carrier protein
VPEQDQLPKNKYDHGGRGVFTTLERLQKLFIARFHFKIEELAATTTLEYLGLDSLNIIEIMFDIENEFNIRVPDQELRELAVTTIQDMVDALDRFISEQDPGQAIGTSSRN